MRTVYLANVNDDRSVPDILPQYSIRARIATMMSGLTEDIVGLTEVRECNVRFVESELIAAGYTVVTMRYTPNLTRPNTTHCYMLGYKNVTLVTALPYWFTASPGIPLDDSGRIADMMLRKYGESFERGTLCTVFKDGPRYIAVFLVHLGMYRRSSERQYTRKCAKMLSRLIETTRKVYTSAIAVAGPDFNAIDGSAHMNRLLSLTDCTPTGSTFCAYPWDLGPPLAYTATVAATTRRKLAACTDAAQYIECCREYHRAVSGGPTKESFDRIMCSQPCIVVASQDFDVLSIDDYAEVPFAPSDHVSYSVYV